MHGRLVADLADEREDRRGEERETGVPGLGGGHCGTSLRFDDADPRDELRRTEPSQCLGFELGARPTVVHTLDGFEEVILGLGNDVVGVREPRHGEAQLAQIRRDQVVAGHGGAPTTRCMVIANALHSARRSRAAVSPRRVNE
jgi:hypothetical protein